MTFPRELLADHEEIVFDLKPHWVALIPSVLWTIAALVVLFFGYRASEGIFEEDSETSKSVVGAIVTIGWIILALVPALRWRFTLFVLTTDRLITRSGIIAKQSKEIPLERINDVAFSQSIIERMVGAGDLLVESAGERGQTKISNVRKPQDVQLMIYKEVEKNNARMMRPGTTTEAGTSIPEQIQALARLKDQGVLTEAEFEAKKQELLKRL
jgi:uncharacterized membrane protein YdbT with pleckstrin-like domain